MLEHLMNSINRFTGNNTDGAGYRQNKLYLTITLFSSINTGTGSGSTSVIFFGICEQ